MDPHGTDDDDPTAARSAASTSDPVRLVRVEPSWGDVYTLVAQEVLAVLGDAMTSPDGRLLELHHVGSTAVPGSIAKPTLDVMVRLARWPLDDAAIAALTRLGYHDRGEHGIPGRHYLSRDGHAVHLHLVAPDGAHLRRHLAFRDLLRGDAAVRSAYESRKRRLVDDAAGDRAAYVEGKSAWVRATTASAVERLPERVGFGPVRELARSVDDADAVPGAVGSWAVGGGWALDLAHGGPRRAHDDLDVVLDRGTAEAWLAAVATQDVRFRVVGGGSVGPWSPGRPLPSGPCRVEARLGPAIAPSPAAGAPTAGAPTAGASVAASPGFWDVALEERPAGRWILRTDPEVGLPVADAIVLHALEDDRGVHLVPALAPEVALLCKARLSGRPPGDPKDEADFEATASRLEPAARAWLASALARPPRHPWAARLRPGAGVSGGPS